MIPKNGNRLSERITLQRDVQATIRLERDWVMVRGAAPMAAALPAHI
jgi:hypothetical protein